MILQDQEVIIRANKDTIKVNFTIMSVDFDQLQQEKKYCEDFFKLKFPNAKITWNDNV